MTAAADFALRASEASRRGDHREAVRLAIASLRAAAREALAGWWGRP